MGEMVVRGVSGEGCESPDDTTRPRTRWLAHTFSITCAVSCCDL